jgi:hypothetical protein
VSEPHRPPARAPDPIAVFAGALVVALVLCVPILHAALTGRADFGVAAFRYLVAFGGAWVGLNGLARIWAGYAAGPASPPPGSADETAPPAGADTRRADDAPVEESAT